jgi:hypothetical protein
VGEHCFSFANWVQREAVVSRLDRANVFDLISVMVALLPTGGMFLAIKGPCFAITHARTGYDSFINGYLKKHQGSFKV